MIEILAPAKINFFLHVGPTRRDGLHEITSLFAFASVGDLIRVAPARDLSLAVEGEFAGALAACRPEDNLVMRAALELRRAARVHGGAAITLQKNLPIASGVGGGSGDAAATLIALRRLWGADLGLTALERLAFRLGADVPACLRAAPVWVGGAGEIVRPGPSLPPLWIALVNPRRPMPTGPVFRAFDAACPNPLPPAVPPAPTRDFDGVRRLFSRSRNDLESVAAKREPAIGAAADFLRRRPGQIAVRMSGSGATVFGLFSSPLAAQAAARAAAAHGWWAKAGAVIGASRGRGHGDRP